MSNGERRVFWVQEHVRKRADGTEVTIPGHFRSEPPPPDTGLPEDLIRIGINLTPGGENMSGAVFPASLVDEVVAALKKAG
jgi:hypothetical protein